MIHISQAKVDELVVIDPNECPADLVGIVFRITKNFGRKNTVEMVPVRATDAQPIHINALGLDLFDADEHMVVI